MRPLVATLLVFSGIATAWMNWSLLILSMWGRPTHPIQVIALVGSLVQVIAGAVLLWREKALGSAGIGLALNWLFYAPALFNTMRADWTQLSFRPNGAVPPLLLILCTIFFIWYAVI